MLGSRSRAFGVWEVAIGVMGVQEVDDFRIRSRAGALWLQHDGSKGYPLPRTAHG